MCVYGTALGAAKTIRAVRLSTFNSSLLLQRRHTSESERRVQSIVSYNHHFLDSCVTHIVLVFLVSVSVSLRGHGAILPVADPLPSNGYHEKKTLPGECRKSRQPFLLSSVLQILQHTPDDGKCSKHLHNIVQAFFCLHFLRTGFDVTIFRRWKKNH